ncbi:MAG: sigma factor-like helix-turn-helix DNA-binding protein, partial [Nitrososphaeria archaeon]
IASTLKNQVRTQKEIAEVAGVTEVTIRNRYKEISKHLRINLDEKSEG